MKNAMAYNLITAIVILGAIAVALIFFPIPGCVRIETPPTPERSN
jgi:hypothetical protein